MLLKIKAEWVAALRSGEYKQGTSFLYRSNGTYCCLGVLAKTQLLRTKPELHRSLLTPEELGMLGMSEAIATRLVLFNDNRGMSFSEIADWIEKHDMITGELI